MGLITRLEHKILCDRCGDTEVLYTDPHARQNVEIGSFPGWWLLASTNNDDQTPKYQYLCGQCKVALDRFMMRGNIDDPRLTDESY